LNLHVLHVSCEKISSCPAARVSPNLQYAWGMSFEPLRVPRAIPVAVLLLVLAVPSAAQTPTPPAVVPLRVPPIPWLVIDARGGFTSTGKDTITASDLGVAVTDLPGRLPTVVVGAHIYPLRHARLKIGLGGEWLSGEASSQKKDAKGEAAGPKIRRRLNSVSGQVSMNFGRGAGWSYITVGYGPAKYESYLDGAAPDGVKMNTLNWGGGGRWFAWSHLAINLDLRFYLTRPSNPTTATAGTARQRLVLFSAGISLK